MQSRYPTQLVSLNWSVYESSMQAYGVDMYAVRIPKSNSSVTPISTANLVVFYRYLTSKLVACLRPPHNQ